MRWLRLGGVFATAVALSFCLPRVARAQETTIKPTGPTGTWQVEGGTPFRWEAVLRADGAHLLGAVSSCSSTPGAAPRWIFDGQISGTTITFRCQFEGQRTVWLTGNVNGDEIEFSWELQVREGADPRAADDMFGASALKRFIAKRVPNATDVVADEAARTYSSQLSWVTLGTQGGPTPNRERSQPANLLVVEGYPWMVDCGDGAMERLAGANFLPVQVHTAFISHLHLDHIGGLQGLIALHWVGVLLSTDVLPEMRVSGFNDVLTIYGPPGTDVVVNGILQSLTVEAQMTPGKPRPEQVTRVVIVKDGSDLTVDGVRVRAVRNSHFDGSPEDSVSQSLSYRFDYKGYGIGYTGDTGPSDAITRLVNGADVLVSEVGDPANTAAVSNSKSLSPEAKAARLHHLLVQHLTPHEAGAIAESAGVRRLVFTHYPVPTNTGVQKYIDGAHETFKGEVIVAHDLDRF